MPDIQNNKIDDIIKQVDNAKEKHSDGSWYNKEMELASKEVADYIKSTLDNSRNNIQSFASEIQKEKYTNIRNNLNTELVEITKDLTSFSYIRRHKIVLNDISHKIDNAENAIIDIIKQVQRQQTLQKTKTEENNLLSEINKSQNYFETGDNGTLTLTANTNRPRIDQILGDVMNTGSTRLIDYSACKNEGIKNRMINAIGGQTCYIVKGVDSSGNDTYLLKNKKGEKLNQRALIWEGVSLTSDLSLQEKALDQIHKEEINKLTKKELNEQEINDFKNIVPKDLQKELDDESISLKDFIVTSDKALNKIIINAKNHGWDLSTEEPVSKLTWTGGLMEVHLISKETTKDVGPIFTEESLAKFPNLYDVLDSNESDLKDYLTTRIKQKWNEYDKLTKRENILSNPEQKETEESIENSVKNDALYGLGLVDNLINNLRNDKGDTRSKQDKRIIEMQNFVKDAIYSINNGKPTKSDLKNIEKKLNELFNGYYNANRLGIKPESSVYNDIIFGGKEKTIHGVRKLTEHMSLLDNTYTTFLRDEIMENQDFQIKNKEYQSYFDRIADLFTIPDDTDELPETLTKHVDELINIINTEETPNVKQNQILQYLQSIGILPKNVSIKDDKIKEGCEKLYHILENKNKTINNLEKTINIESMKKSLEKEKLLLESKSEKSETEITRLNSLLYLLKDDSVLESYMKEHIEKLKVMMLYGGIDNEIKGSFGVRLAKEGGGVTGSNSEIFNDSIGSGGWFDLSDENTERLGPILQMILEEVAIAIVAIAVGAVTGGAGAAAIYGARMAMAGARGAKYAKIIKNILKIKNFKKYYKLGKAELNIVQKGTNVARQANAAKKVTKLGRFAAKNNPFVYAPELGKGIQSIARGTSLVLEGTAFHLSSTVLHNIKDGKPLGEGLDPFGYTEGPDGKKISNLRMYVQSIAFLGILKTIGQPIQSLSQSAVTRIMGKTLSATQMGTIVKNMTSIGGELGTLITTEQLLSLTFDQKLGHMDTESFIHMLGMVLGLRGYHALQGRGKTLIKEWKKGKDGKSVELVTLEVTKNNTTYETVINSKGEIVRTTDPSLKPGMEIKVNEYGARSSIQNKLPANRNNTASYIAKNRYENGKNKSNEGLPTEVEIRSGEKVKIDHNGKYKEIVNKYKDLIQKNKENPNLDITSELSKLDIQLAERITLDRGKAIEYTSEGEARSSFEQLSKIQEYNSTLRTYKNFKGKRCVEKISSNTIMPNIYISIKGMEGRRGLDYTGATIKNFEIPIKNLKTGDQIFSEFGGKRYEFSKKENGNWEVISEGGRFEKGNEVKLNKNKDGTITFERIGDARKMEVSEIGLKKFTSSQSEVIIKDVIDTKQIEKFVDNFDVQIMSEKGITIDGKNYKIIYEANMTQNQNRNGVWKFIVDGKVETSVQAETKVLPENSNGNRIREKYYELRDKYVATEISKSGKEVNIKEQKEREQKEREQKEREQKEKEQKEREQKEREQKEREQEEKEQKEREQKERKKLVENADTFSDLNKIIEKIGEIDGVKGKKLSAEQVKDLINQAKNGYISGELISLDFLPSQYGIKNKVEMLIKNQQEFTFKVDNAKSFEELYNILKNQKIIEGSQQNYTAKEMLDIIKLVRKGTLTSDRITRNFGLREKFNGLINAELISQPIKKLWPDGLMKDISQGGIGNCYFVACLYNLKIHPNGAKLISDMIKIRQVETNIRGKKIMNEEYDVSFYKANGTKIKVTVTQADIQQGRTYSAALREGQLGDYILERAYNRFIHAERGGIAGQTVFRNNNKQGLLIEGGWMEQTFGHFFGPLVKSNIGPEIGRYGLNKTEFLGYFSNVSKNDIFTFGSLDKGSVTIEQGRKIYPNKSEAEIQRILADKNGDIDTYFVKDIYGKQQEVHFGHAYSVGEINIKEGWVEIVNPHNTQSKRFQISLNEAYDVFGSFSKTEFYDNIPAPIPVHI